MASEVDLARTLHTIAAALNDHKFDHFDAHRVQELATGALGGEQKLIAYGSGTSGELREGSVNGAPVAKLTLAEGEWSIERIPAARKSEQLEQYEQERTEQTATEYQKPVRGRIAIWKK